MCNCIYYFWSELLFISIEEVCCKNDNLASEIALNLVNISNISHFDYYKIISFLSRNVLFVLSDHGIFIFSTPKYLNEIDYQRDINQRLQFIKANIDKKTDEKVHGIWLIGSFADKFSDRKASWGKVISIIKTKRYCDISKNNACLNLTKEDELKAYYEKMFKS